LVKGMDLTLAEFAREIGVSASTIKKTVEDIRPMSQELCSKIFAETGVLFIPAKEGEMEPLVYTKKDHRKFKSETVFSEHGAKCAAGLVAKQVELLLLAASRPTVEKSLPVFTALLLALNKIKDEYHLEKNIEALLRERHATQTKLYTVKELRDNNLLAKQVDFKDDPKLKDEEELPLSKTVGWLPVKDCFNIFWQNRELFNELAALDDETMTPEQKARMEKMGDQMDNEIDAFMPGFKSSAK
jgi:transcriptional regulator with XRE-family HTH domain